MAALLLLLLLGIAFFEVSVAIAVMTEQGLSRLFRSLYWLVTLLALVVTVGMTAFFSYYSNPNTHVYGWPVSCVIFQRDTPTSPWLDYVGPAVVLAYPLNFILYMFVPSVVLLFLARRRKREPHNAA